MKRIDVLFYQVIHNKFLFQLIFKHIHQDGWIKYDGYNQIDNRIKFKNIKSLRWIVEKKQYWLFKCKLESGDNIEINDFAIDELLKFGYSNSTRYHEEGELKEKEANKIINEILIPLLNYKGLELYQFDLLKMLLDYNKNYIPISIQIRVVTLLTSEPYSFQIFPSLIETIIRHFSGPLLEAVVNLPTTTIPEEIKINSVYFALHNNVFMEEILELIINTPKLLPTSEGGPLKKLKQSDGSKIIKEFEIDNSLFEKVKSNKIKAKLLELYNISNESVYNGNPQNKNLDLFSIKKNYQIIKEKGDFQYILVKDKEVIDRINEKVVSLSEFRNHFGLLGNISCHPFQYQTFELLGYAIDTFILNPFLSIDNNKKKVLKTMFCYTVNNSIINLDITLLNQIESLYKQHNIKFGFKFQKTITLENIVQFFNYLNSTEYISVSQNLFKLLVKEVVNYLSTIENVREITRLGLKINFNKFIKQSVNMSIKAIAGGSLILIDLMFNNGFNPISTQFFKNEWNLYSMTDKKDKSFKIGYFGLTLEDNVYCSHTTLFNIYRTKGACKPDGPFYCTSNESTKDIISITNLLLSSMSVEKKAALDYIETIEIVINCLYKRLIRTKGIMKWENNYIRKLIIDSFNESNYKFKFQHTLFHSFYYLAIKSIKLINYIMALPSVLEMLSNSLSMSFDENQVINRSSVNYTFKNYLDINIYTYDYIFSCTYSTILEEQSFDEILLNLINNFVHLPSTRDNDLIAKFPDFYTKSINATLQFLLEIGKDQLFFEQLEIIQKQLDDANLIIGSFPTKVLLENNCNCPCSINLKPLVNGRVISFSKELINTASKCLDPESFKLFCSTCSFQSIRDSLIKNYKQLDSFDIQPLLRYSEIINHIVSVHYNQKNYWSIIFRYFKNDDKIIEYILIEYSNQLINSKNSLINMGILEIFFKYCKYNIKIRNSLIKAFPNNHNFKITKQTISEAICDEKINFIKYYYQTGLINNDRGNNIETTLLEHLKAELLNHSDYKYVNWLK